jgi:hypothetical protein
VVLQKRAEAIGNVAGNGRMLGSQLRDFWYRGECAAQGSVVESPSSDLHVPVNIQRRQVFPKRRRQIGWHYRTVSHPYRKSSTGTVETPEDVCTEFIASVDAGCEHFPQGSEKGGGVVACRETIIGVATRFRERIVEFDKSLSQCLTQRVDHPTSLTVIQ